MSTYKVNRFYNKDTDYQDLINKAIASGDYSAAADAESKRNAKITGEGSDYSRTYNYLDIGNEINKGIKNGVSADYMQEMLNARNSKIKNNKEYSPYYNDNIQNQGKKYYYNSLNGIGGNYENKPTYEKLYSDEIDNLVKKYVNREAFEYDLESDPSYQAVKATAENQARKAATDTLAEYSQYGGGTNSYAVSAATQAGNNLRAKVTEAIPTLYQNAYDRYLQEGTQDANKISLLKSLDDSAYQRYLSDYNVFNTDRQFAENQYESDYAKTYQEGKDSLSDERYDEALEYEKSEALKQQNIEQAYNLIQKGIQVPESVLKAAGFDTEEQLKAYKELADRYLAEWNANMESANLANEYSRKQIANYGLGGSSGGSSRKSSSGSSEEDEDDEKGAILSQKKVDDIVKYLNDAAGKYKGSDGEALTALRNFGDKEYTVGDSGAAFVVKKVYSLNYLTQEQKEYLIKNKFNISNETLEDVIRDYQGRK